MAQLFTDSIAIDENVGWFVLGYHGLLCKINLKNGIAEYVSKLPVDDIQIFRQQGKCFKWNNLIYCLPLYSNCICVYDIENRNWDKITISKSNACIFDYYIDDKVIMLLSQGERAIYYLDPYKKTIIGKYVIDEDKNCILKASVRYNGTLKILGNNAIYSFDIKERVLSDKVVLNVDDDLNTICTDGHSFYLTGMKKAIYQFSESEKCRTVGSFPDEFGCFMYNSNGDEVVDYELNSLQSPLFFRSYSIGDKLWLIPFKGTDIVIYDIKVHKISSYIIKEAQIKNRKDLNNYSYLQIIYLIVYYKDERYIGLISSDGCYLFHIDGETGYHTTLRIDYSDVIRRGKPYPVVETRYYGVSDLFKVV